VSVNPAEPPSSEADLSLVMPCFNEEVVVGYTIPQLLDAFESSGHRLQLVAVDNGSSDRTGEIIDELADRHSRVTPHRIEVNEGYGNGILQGFPLCTAGWIGMIPADGQVDAEDVVRLFDAVRASDGQVIGKVRRRFRMDGVARKVVSVAYNGFMRLLWPRLGSWDVNGNPKIFPRRILASLGLRSKGWLLDPELMVKAHYLGLRVLELNVFARMRGGGLSHVRAATCWEFFRKLLVLRFSPELARWRREVDPTALRGEGSHSGSGAG